MFFAVSGRLSPFSALDPAAEKLTTSAESHFPAISNDVRVLVEGSKKRFTTVFPRRAGTFLISRPAISLRDSAVSRIVWISDASRVLISKRSFAFQAMFISSRLLDRFFNHDAVLTVVLAQ